jgi:outer membrane lipoprotein LolB
MPVAAQPWLARLSRRGPARIAHSAGASVAAIAAVLLTACATAPAPSPLAPAAPPAIDAPFELSARVAARRGDDSVAVNVGWRHEPPRDRLTVSSPFGQTLAELEGEDGSVRLVQADGMVAVAADWPTLTERALGVPLPVAGMAWWIRGWPRPDRAHGVDRDAAGRATLLRQDGWEVTYRYGDATGDARPSRVNLAYPGFDVRIVIDAWQ